MNKRYIYNKKGNYYNNLKIKNISKLEALILGNRDIIDPQKVKMFINPKIDDLYDPFLLNDMKEAVNLIISILKNNGKIRIFGDYDQDGITSIMTLIDGLLYFTDNISYDIADRFEDGYGISEKMVKKAIDDKVSLVITCDIGITAFDEIKKLRDSGINVILTDHHQVKKEEENEWVNQILPDANCVINPHRLDSNYPFSELCGAGVSFKLMQALFLKTNSDLEYLYSLLEYVAIGTVGDVVDLVDENRILVIEGLKRLNNTDKIAIKALLEQNGWNKKIDSYTLGFILSPLLNSTGRLSSAKEAVSLLMEEDIDKIYEKSSKIVSLNNLRKEKTEKGFEIVDKIVKEEYDNSKILVVYSNKLEESVCGIVAGRIREKYNKPTIILTNSSIDDVIKGSGRSIENYNMFENVGKYKENLESFGGHPMACGLSIKKNKLSELRDFLNKNSNLKDDDFLPIINIDGKIDISKITLEFAYSINKLEPFGKSNPRPIFADKNVKIEKIDLIGKNKDTLKIIFEKNSRRINAIKFNSKDFLEKFSYNNINEFINKKVDIVYYIDINNYLGKDFLQIKLIDMR